MSINFKCMNKDKIFDEINKDLKVTESDIKIISDGDMANTALGKKLRNKKILELIK